MNVLITDNSQELCNSVEKHLKYRGYNADTEYDGQKGLRKALSNEYDIILLDIMMPQSRYILTALRQNPKQLF